MVKWLELYGVDTVFGIPGVHTVELYRGLGRSDIRHITPRHEQGAGFMADGYARASGRVAACFIITGPGMTNIATALGQAYADSIPMLVISSVNRVAELGSGDGRLHELPSQARLISGLTAFSHTLLTPAELPQVLARAFAVFNSARPRPVHIEIPIDVIAQPSELPATASAVVPSPPGPCPDAVARAAQMLKAAKSPVILLGGGTVSAAAEAQRVAEFLDTPVAMTNNAKGVLPPGHPLSLGSQQSLQPVRDLIRSADVVLAVATELGETDYDIFFNGGFHIDGDIIRVDIESEQLMRNFLPRLAILSDARLFFQQLSKELDIGSHTSVKTSSPGSLKVSAVMRQLTAQKPPDQQFHEAILQCIQTRLPDVIIAGDSTQLIYSGHLGYEARRPRSWFHSATGYGTLGYGLPAAIGAKIARPRHPVVAIVGDGGAQFTLPELACAVENKIPVILLLWNNQGYSEIKKYMRNNNITPLGVDIYTPDFLQLARGFGCTAHRAGHMEQLVDLLPQATASDVPVLIEIDENLFRAVP